MGAVHLSRYITSGMNNSDCIWSDTCLGAQTPGITAVYDYKIQSAQTANEYCLIKPVVDDYIQTVYITASGRPGELAEKPAHRGRKTAATKNQAKRLPPNTPHSVQRRN